MSRELDEQCARALGHKVIEWRVCTTDPESGQWEELQDWAAESGLGEGDVIWTRPAERHPCYNWLDTDGPKQNGWTDEHAAETSRSHYWRVLPFYSSDLRAVRQLEDEIEWRGLQRRYVYALDREVDIQYEGSGYDIDHIFQFIRATPEQKARAFVEAFK